MKDFRTHKDQSVTFILQRCLFNFKWHSQAAPADLCVKRFSLLLQQPTASMPAAKQIASTPCFFVCSEYVTGLCTTHFHQGSLKNFSRDDFSLLRESWFNEIKPLCKCKFTFWWENSKAFCSDKLKMLCLDFDITSNQTTCKQWNPIKNKTRLYQNCVLITLKWDTTTVAKLTSNI